MDHNDIIAADRDGTLPNYSLSELKEMRVICARHLQSGNQIMIRPCESVEREIVRKETAESEQRAAARQEELAKMEQQREAEHTLWVYLKLATWSERLGVFGVFGLLFLAGFLCAKNAVISRVIDLIISMKP
jgi:hypothetical protein